MKVIKLINNVLNGFNAQLLRYPSTDTARRLQLLKTYNINKVLDIGANRGLYGTELRELGFEGKIISFEPLSAVYQNLDKRAKNDANWITHNYALGDSDSELEINVAGNTDSSSLLDMLPAHEESAPQSIYVNKERIKVHKLDTVFSELCGENDRIYAKIDTQGFEKNVLDGAEHSLRFITGIQIEMSIVPLYDKQILYKELTEMLERSGFSLYSIENGFYNAETGQLLQFDGIFFRDKP